MFSLIDRSTANKTSSGVSIDSLGDKEYLRRLHGRWDIQCHCCHAPIKMVVKHRRDTDTYFLSSLPDSPLHNPECPLFRQRKTLLPDVFVPISRVDFFTAQQIVSVKDKGEVQSKKDCTFKVMSNMDTGKPASIKDNAQAKLYPSHQGSKVQITTPSMMESLLITLAYNSFSHIHFGNFVTVKDFVEKVKHSDANKNITFPNATSVTDGLFFGENGLVIAKKHAMRNGAALWMRLASHVTQDASGLLVNNKKLITKHVEWPYKSESNTWMLASLVHSSGILDTTLVYPVCDLRHVILYQREVQQALVRSISPLLYGMNNSKIHRFYSTTPLHSNRHEDNYIVADMILTRKNKESGALKRLVFGQCNLDILKVVYDATAYESKDILLKPEIIKELLHE